MTDRKCSCESCEGCIQICGCKYCAMARQAGVDQHQWISVSESNPTEDGQYEVTLACEKKEEVPQEFIRGIKYFTIEKTERDKDICGWEHDSVVAWKFKSKPYQPQTSTKKENDNKNN